MHCPAGGTTATGSAAMRGLTLSEIMFGWVLWVKKQLSVIFILWLIVVDVKKVYYDGKRPTADC